MSRGSFPGEEAPQGIQDAEGSATIFFDLMGEKAHAYVDRG
jgi:hypothetical protein